MAYKKETERAIINSKVMLDLALYDDDYHRTFKQYVIDRNKVKQIWHALEQLIYENKISYDLQDEDAREFDTTTADGALATLQKVYLMMNSIDDPWFWSEHEYEMTDILLTLRDILGIEE